QRQEVEEQSALGFSGERDHLALLLLGSGLVNVLQVGGLAAKARAIVHDFAVDLAGCEVDKAQDSPQRADVSASKRSAGFWLVLWFLYHMARLPLGLPGLLVRRTVGFRLWASGFRVLQYFSSLRWPWAEGRRPKPDAQSPKSILTAPPALDNTPLSPSHRRRGGSTTACNLADLPESLCRDARRTVTHGLGIPACTDCERLRRGGRRRPQCLTG